MTFRAIALLLAAVAAGAGLRAGAAPAPVKLVVVTTFEAGRDTGDRPGEFQYWIEREHLTQAVDVPGLSRLVYTNGQGLYAVMCGSREEAALNLMVLGQDPRFDFSQAYWLVAGIGDIDPNEGSLGSAVWIQQVVNGDVAFELDSRDAPADWPYSIVQLRSTDPDDRPVPSLAHPEGMIYALNLRLASMAFRVSRHTGMLDKPHYQNVRREYQGFPLAIEPPRVMEGDSLATLRYWHGRTLNTWAGDWVSYWTNNQGTFVMSDPEDHIICAALTKLSSIGRVDFQRVMILRGAAQYTVAPPEKKVSHPYEEQFPGDLLAYENVYRTGAPVVAEILGNWDIYGPQPP